MVCVTDAISGSELRCDPTESLPTSTQLRAGMDTYDHRGEAVGTDAGRQAAYQLWSVSEKVTEWQEIESLINRTLACETTDPLGVQAHCFDIALSTTGDTDDYYQWWDTHNRNCIDFARNHQLWRLYCQAVAKRIERENDRIYRYATGSTSIDREEIFARQRDIIDFGEAALATAPSNAGYIFHSLIGVYQSFGGKPAQRAIIDRWIAAASDPRELYEAYFWGFVHTEPDACWPYARHAIEIAEQIVHTAKPDDLHDAAMMLWDCHREVATKNWFNAQLPENMVQKSLRHFDKSITVLTTYLAGSEGYLSMLVASYMERGDFCKQHHRYSAARRNYRTAVRFSEEYAQVMAGNALDEHESLNLIDAWLKIAYIDKHRNKPQLVAHTRDVVDALINTLPIDEELLPFYRDKLEELSQWCDQHQYPAKRPRPRQPRRTKHRTTKR